MKSGSARKVYHLKTVPQGQPRQPEMAPGPVEWEIMMS